MTFHSECKNPAFNKTMRRDLISKQVMKVCFLCKKPFNRRKGRAKAVAVAHVTGRYICEHCANKPAGCEASSATRYDGLDAKGTSRH